ncbi:unnamed protein product [Leptosia nina]|uniref:Uncharacterized protein n=1 Tax=Leptosia nina TaxID=320188 RepID=A0AAV1IYT0_9NEOP
MTSLTHERMRHAPLPSPNAADDLINAKEQFNDIGNDIDDTAVELIPGVEMTERQIDMIARAKEERLKKAQQPQPPPKEPTPPPKAPTPPPKAPTPPPKEPTPPPPEPTPAEPAPAEPAPLNPPRSLLRQNPHQQNLRRRNPRRKRPPPNKPPKIVPIQKLLINS